MSLPSSPDPAERPHPARGRFGAFVDRLLDSHFGGRLGVWLDRWLASGNPVEAAMCVVCTSLAGSERERFPIITVCRPKSEPDPALMEALTELAARARHAPDVCPSAPVGDCDVCQVTVDVVGVDGCAVGVNHRVMNIRRRDGRTFS